MTVSRYFRETVQLGVMFLCVCTLPGWSEVHNAGSVIKETVSKNGEYSVVRERVVVAPNAGKRSKIRNIDILKDKAGNTLWEKTLPGEVEEVQIVDGKPNVIVNVYSLNRSVRFDEKGNVIRLGDKFPKQLKIKDEFSGWSGARNPLQIIENKTGKVLKELPYEDMNLNHISEDGQFFVVLESTLVYKQETLDYIAKIQKYIEENSDAIKQGKISEPSYDYSEKDVEKREYYLALYDVNNMPVWKKLVLPLGPLTTPCCPVIETISGSIYVFLHEEKPDNINERLKRKFNDKGIEIKE